jgi:intergrase/recombinase
MIEMVPCEVARLIQSRFRDLRISKARYEDLPGEADPYYSEYLEKLVAVLSKR